MWDGDGLVNAMQEKGPRARVRWGRPAPYRGWAGEVFRWVSAAYLWAAGWTVAGDWPPLAKAVLVAAPHTSNWDAVNMLAAAGYYRVTLRWMGKASLTQGPFGWLIRALGCVPVDRSMRHDMVGALAAAFGACDAMVLAVPPEGTRGAVRVWKSGFYHIARLAGVPIMLAVMDYGAKRVGIAGVFQPTGDYDADLAAIRGYYRGAVGLRPEGFVAGA